MTRKEFLDAKLALSKEFKARKSELIKQFVLSNNPYKVGDIVCDHAGKGKIREIRVDYFLETCLYVCDNITQEGTANLKEPVRFIYQSEIKTDYLPI